jgi:hypothetical protein
MPALNPPPSYNNILGLAAAMAPMGRGDAGYCDTGEPTAANSGPGTIVKTATFPVNGVGTQPQVARGAWALVVKAVNAATLVGAVIVTATDGTNTEVIASFGAAGTAGQGQCLAEPFVTSICAGADKGVLSNVVSLSCSVVLTSGTGATIMFAAVGSP